jgi:hypothetical protein
MRAELPFFAQRLSPGSKKILCAKLKSRQFRFEPHKFVAAELALASEAVSRRQPGNARFLWKRALSRCMNSSEKSQVSPAEG